MRDGGRRGNEGRRGDGGRGSIELCFKDLVYYRKN